MNAGDWREPLRQRLSSRQRVVVLTFETAEQALAFDESDDHRALEVLRPTGETS